MHILFYSLAVAIVLKLAPNAEKKLPSVSISSGERSFDIFIASILARATSSEPEKLLKHIKITSFIVYEVIFKKVHEGHFLEYFGTGIECSLLGLSKEPAK